MNKIYRGLLLALLFTSNITSVQSATEDKEKILGLPPRFMMCSSCKIELPGNLHRKKEKVTEDDGGEKVIEFKEKILKLDASASCLKKAYNYTIEKLKANGVKISFLSDNEENIEIESDYDTDTKFEHTVCLTAINGVYSTFNKTIAD